MFKNRRPLVSAVICRSLTGVTGSQWHESMTICLATKGYRITYYELDFGVQIDIITISVKRRHLQSGQRPPQSVRFCASRI